MIFHYLKGAYKRLLFNLSAQNSFLYNIYCKYLYKPRKGSLAEMINEFSRRRTCVVFLQVGANDGFFNDPLHKFIKRYKWKGVLLEPQRYVFEQYLSRLYLSTEGVIPVNAALDYCDGEKSIYKISFSQARWATGLTSFNRSALQEAIESGHVQRCARRYGEQIPESGDLITEEKVTCISPETLRRNYNLEEVDWLQIDAEGYDFEIIKMLDLSKMNVQVVALEHSHLSPADHEACINLLRQLNYAVKKISENTVAMKKPLGEFSHFFPEEPGQ